MKVIGINGSPRKTWHSAQLLDNALEGARAAGAETKRIDLFDLDFRGCISCFACKRLGGPSYTKCAQRDALTPVARGRSSPQMRSSSPRRVYYGEVLALCAISTNGCSSHRTITPAAHQTKLRSPHPLRAHLHHGRARSGSA